jgi:hypothetical protein
MSDESRQRIIREAGHKPAEAEKESSAGASRQQLAQEQAAEGGGGPSSPDEPTPLSQSDDEKPRPRS